MKRLIGFVLFLMVFSFACSFMSSGPSAQDVKSTINAGIALTLAAQPAPTKAPVQTVAPSDTPQPAQNTDTNVTPAGSSCQAPSLDPSPSGWITKVTLAKDAQGSTKDPVGATTVFSNSATIHAVAALKNAPNNTSFKSVWYAQDTNGAADCNTKIDDYTVSTNGTRNIDFNLKPNSTWPAGTYRVEIYVNGTLDTVSYYTVK